MDFNRLNGQMRYTIIISYLCYFTLFMEDLISKEKIKFHQKKKFRTF